MVFEELMIERGIEIAPSTAQRWVVKKLLAQAGGWMKLRCDKLSILITLLNRISKYSGWVQNRLTH